MDKNEVHRLASLDFLKEQKDLFIIGSTGTGKSYLATALSFHVCQRGYSILYALTAKLMGQLKLAKAKGTNLTKLKRIGRMYLLILEDFGLQPFDSQSRVTLLDIIEKRYGKKSTLVTSQYLLKNGITLLEKKLPVDAVLDRIVHQSLRVELYGESLRGKKSHQECLYL